MDKFYRNSSIVCHVLIKCGNIIRLLAFWFKVHGKLCVSGQKSGGQELIGGLNCTVHRNFFGSQVKMTYDKFGPLCLIRGYSLALVAHFLVSHTQYNVFGSYKILIYLLIISFGNVWRC